MSPKVKMTRMTKITIKKVVRKVQILIKGGEAAVTPPIGPILGQFPLDIKSFCNSFNNETKDFDKGVILKVILILYKDGTFTYKVSSPPLTFLLELAGDVLNIKNNYRNKKGITLYDIYLIALIKKLMVDYLLYK